MITPTTIPWSVHTARLRRSNRQAWWHGFLGGLLATGAILWLADTVVNQRWHLL
jgi:hypothetical protein